VIWTARWCGNLYIASVKLGDREASIVQFKDGTLAWWPQLGKGVVCRDIREPKMHAENYVKEAK